MKLNGAIKPQGASTIHSSGGSRGANHRNENISNNDNNKYNKIYNNNRSSNFRNSHMKSSKNIMENIKIYKNNCIHNNNNNNNKASINKYISYSRITMTRIKQSINFYLWFIVCIFYVLSLFSNTVYCDDNENGFLVNGFSMGPEMTTPEFDYASRGRKKFGDKCETTLECGFPGSVCDSKKKSCQCTEDLPVTNHLDKCGKGASINESCFFNEQCEAVHFQTECRDGRCVCRFEMTPIQTKEGIYECKGKQIKREPERYIDPAMIGVLVGMALMFIIICVVLRLFSNARWRENRTIFNTPNPRLMNVSLLRDSKLLHGQERRGSRISVRVPSRQPSMASLALRPHSPNPSLGSRGTASRGSSNASMTSIKSNRSNVGATTNLIVSGGTVRRNSINKQHQQEHNNHSAQQPLMANITSNPAADNVTVEIVEPNK